MKTTTTILRTLTGLAAALFVFAANVSARNYILMSSDGRLPDNVAASVRAAGGNITQFLPQIGAVMVESDDPRFAASIRSLRGFSLLPDIRWTTPAPFTATMEAVEDADAAPVAEALTITDNRLPLQWGLTAIDARAAWDQGYLGAGVRVAILDSGIATGHVEFGGSVNLLLSRSFVPGEAFNFTGTGFNHGTHVAGTVAARINGVGSVGVAPAAELVAVKVLSATTGSGSFGGILSGIVYAADIESDVINMSLGAEFPRHGFTDDNGTPDDPDDDVRVKANEISELVTLLNRATTYAHNRGVTIVVAAGNSAIDRDHDADMWVVPADCPHVIAVSATGPIGWAKDIAGTYLDNLTSYSNYGQSRIDLAAPGGDFIYPGEESITIFGVNRPVWVFDMVYGPVNRVGTMNLYGWAAGTSMAAPHVSGVAALIIGKHGGKLDPSAVQMILNASAEDLGKPGNDDAYGAGRVNAAAAVQ